MSDAFKPENDSYVRDADRRLAALRSYSILDTSPEAPFNDAVELLRIICKVPIALVSLIDSNRQFFKAKAGLTACETGLDTSVCALAIRQDDLFTIEDLSIDDRTSSMSLIAGEPRLRFYAGMPLITSKGVALGSLCAIDTIPREGGLTIDQQIALRLLARQVVAAIELRGEVVGRDDTIARQEVLHVRQAEELERMWVTSPDLLVVLDFEGVFHRVNPAWTETLGYKQEELVGHHVNEFVIEDDNAVTVDAYEEAAAGGVPRVENRYRHKDGSTRSISWVAAPSADTIYAIGRDVTAERRNAAALADVAADRDRTWRNSSDLILVLEMSGEIISANPAATSLIGASAEQIVGRDVRDFIHPDDLPPRTTSGILDRDRYNGDRLFKNRYRSSEGEWRHIAWSVTIHDDRVYCYGRDITIERDQAEALAATEDSLRQSQKMEAVGQLTGGLAHDFNNLLAGISGSLELMQIRLTQGRLSDVDKYVMAAQGATKRAAALTHRLLAFSRRQTLDPKPTDINRLVAGMDELIRRSIGPTIEMEIVGAVGLWPALVDGSQLENALLNLCINARDAMPDGGRITIETANKWIDRQAARMHDLPEGQYLSVCVTDTGTGMTPDIIAKAFDPFFTTKPLGQGTGLGLSMIYGFAKQSGGQVRIYSEIGEGSTICLYLPRLHGEGVSEDEDLSAGTLPRAEQGETVLVVDDEPIVRMLVTDVLEELGYTAIEASDSIAGLKVLQSDVRIDLLVSDVGLPGGMNGRQMADAARIGRPDLKVLFITGYAENAAVGNGLLDHGMAVITKPFAVEALASRIREMFAAGG